ncbi:MAG TPA: presqualene diphosphate synthase HpnD [Terriglobia bacterium]|nr:presqualene diphosphate synthase HpnD [Terriglobia bacterium]
MSLFSRNSRFTSASTTNFYYSFVFLPAEKRRAIEAVYAFARRGDDVTDSGLEPEAAGREIARYRQALDQCYAGNGETPELRALAESIERFRIPRQPFEDLILGLEMDLRGAQYNTFEELALYCYRVASTIGLIAVEIFGYSNPRARDYAVNLGMALQMVNILRDLQSDGHRGRLYLPREDLEQFGVRPDEILAGNFTDPFIELMQFECDRARHFFDLSRQMLPPEDRRSMIAAEIMAAIYWRILKRIQLRRYNVFGERVRLSRPVKFWTALSVYLGVEWQK